MKIAFVNSCPYLGGAELWHLRAALEFRRRGHQVSMVLRSAELAERARAEGIEVHVLPMAFDLDLLGMARAFALFRREKPDIVLLNDQRECRVVAPAAALAGAKVRVQRKGWPYLRGSWRDRIVYGRFVTHVFGNSLQVRDVFREKSGLPSERVRFFPNGFDLGRFPVPDRAARREGRGDPRRAVVVGAAGRLVTQKGYDVLVDALALLMERGFSPMVKIAGEGPERESLEARARSLGVSDVLEFAGQVDDIPGFLAALDIFVFPSRTEGRSNALAEAMCSGLPIAASDIPGNGELIGHGKTGLLFPPEDPAALAESMGRLIADPALAAELGAGARAFAEAELGEKEIMDRVEAYLVGLAEEAAGGSG